jgi:hypothetical protein
MDNLTGPPHHEPIILSFRRTASRGNNETFPTGQPAEQRAFRGSKLRFSATCKCLRNGQAHFGFQHFIHVNEFSIQGFGQCSAYGTLARSHEAH